MSSALPAPLDLDCLRFDWSRDSLRFALAVRADALDECRLHELAALVRLQVDGDSGNTDVLTDVRMLQSQLKIKPVKTMTRVESTTRRARGGLHTLYLEKPIGDLYTKVTVHPAEIDTFDDVLKDMPVLHLVFNCVDYRFDMNILLNKLQYRWLKKVETIEFSNLNCGFHDFTQMFKGTEYRPIHLVVSGARVGNTPTEAQAKMFKRILVHEMKQLRTLKWSATTFNLR